MFTGIIEEIGLVKNIQWGTSSIGLTIGCSKVLEDIKVGDSVAVNGICLTVTGKNGSGFSADVMPETMRRTNLSELQTNREVNLERALKASDRLGGHIVSGHIDGTGTLTGRVQEDNALWLTIEAAPELLRYIVIKGSVALDGTSLTVAYIDAAGFKVSLIPLTAGVTILGKKRIGDTVNIECDIIGKYVEKLLSTNMERPVERSISMEYLREHGFA